MRTQRLTILIMVGMVLGIVTGHFCHSLWPNPDTAKSIAGYISLITDIFLRLIKMIIAPLVFSTLVVGVAHMGDTRAVGRIGAKAMLWFVSASVVSLVLACGYGIGLLGAPVAWYLGSKSLREIDASQGRLGGRGMAQAGKVMGIIGSILLVLGFVALIGLVALAASVSNDPAPADPQHGFLNG